MRPQIRQARGRDLTDLLHLQTACYPFLSTVSQWRREHLESHLRNFPDGQFVADDHGRIVAHCATFRTTSERALRPHSFRDITERGTFNGHVEDGDVLYGAEIMVHPDYRRRGIGRELYQARFDLMRRLGIRLFVAGGRMPGYGDHAERLSPEAYVEDVLSGRVEDRVLSAQTKSGLQVRGVLRDYLNDPKSRNNATLLVWENPDLLAKSRVPARPSKGKAASAR